MRRRARGARSSGSTARGKMYASLSVLVLFIAGSAVCYNVQREYQYDVGNNGAYYSGAVNPNVYREPSQRLFWSEQGSNQVGGTGLWATLTNKFPILGNMFGRMELPTQYGVPGQLDVSSQYGAPAYQPQYQSQYQPQYQAQYEPRYQPQYQVPQQVPQTQFYQQSPQQLGQRFVPFGRDVSLTDDAVIVTPPFVPAAPQPQPAPVPAPQPIPVAPVPVGPLPSPQPSPGYQYNKPQYRLELPHK